MFTCFRPSKATLPRDDARPARAGGGDTVVARSPATAVHVSEDPEFDPSFAYVWVRSMPALGAFDVATLQAATGNFCDLNLLGEGGFGRVYQGRLSDGRKVAVKRLDRRGLQGDKEFMTEVATLNRISHAHIIGLHGVCVQDDHRMCVMDLGCCCLRDGLDAQKAGQPCLSWAQRVQIALDVAEALAYMHQELSPAVVHCDVTSRNILVMENMRASISDFGLAKELPRDGNLTVQEVRSTFGYIAPELASLGRLSAKADAFSFGVLLLEIFTGQHPVDTLRPKGKHLLFELMRPLLSGQLKIGDVLDQHLSREGLSPHLTLLQDIVCSCLKSNPNHRSEVAHVLPLLRRLHEAAFESDNSASTRPRDSVSEMTGLAQKPATQLRILPTRSAHIQDTDQRPCDPPLRSTASARVPDSDNPFSSLKQLNLFPPMVGRALGPQPTTSRRAAGDDTHEVLCPSRPGPLRTATVYQAESAEPTISPVYSRTEAWTTAEAVERTPNIAQDAYPDPTGRCLLCMSGFRDMELRPCGHTVTCSQCTLALASAAGRCPRCSTAVSGFHSALRD